jgi:hypothetical protein
MTSKRRVCVDSSSREKATVSIFEAKVQKQGSQRMGQGGAALAFGRMQPGNIEIQTIGSPILKTRKKILFPGFYDGNRNLTTV